MKKWPSSINAVNLYLLKNFRFILKIFLGYRMSNSGLKLLAVATFGC